MNHTMEFALRTMLVGAGATLAMDLWALTAGWLRCKMSDARVMLRSRATTTKVLSW